MLWALDIDGCFTGGGGGTGVTDDSSTETRGISGSPTTSDSSETDTICVAELLACQEDSACLTCFETLAGNAEVCEAATSDCAGTLEEICCSVEGEGCTENALLGDVMVCVSAEIGCGVFSLADCSATGGGGGGGGVVSPTTTSATDEMDDGSTSASASPGAGAADGTTGTSSSSPGAGGGGTAPSPAAGGDDDGSAAAPSPVAGGDTMDDDDASDADRGVIGGDDDDTGAEATPVEGTDDDGGDQGAADTVTTGAGFAVRPSAVFGGAVFVAAAALF